jgi:hypothetical protein
MTDYPRHSQEAIWRILETDPENIEVRNSAKWVRLWLANELRVRAEHGKINGDFAPTPTPGRHRPEVVL